MSNTSNRFDHINHRIKLALQKSGQPISRPVTLLAVSKHHSIDKINQLYELGQRNFGESYLQEALIKKAQSDHSDIIWHFIGPIQSNKTKDIAQNFQWVHSVDRLKIARRLSAQYSNSSSTSNLNICLQINISQEPQKSGFSKQEVVSVMEELVQLPNLTIRGLMAIPKPCHDFTQQKEAFHQLQKLMQQLNKQFNLSMDTLSMGMSGDLEAAISEGATIVRIGTALFGPREY
ncbi:MAG: YggS family pyridoxal phosphate-dependent enzyme [Gammaproteobacteria bacterium]|nr:YggS family pyridoxal phosphate-dependent enzyme [Gammaproteobacteria bacterium]